MTCVRAAASMLDSYFDRAEGLAESMRISSNNTYRLSPADVPNITVL